MLSVCSHLSLRMWCSMRTDTSSSWWWECCSSLNTYWNNNTVIGLSFVPNKEHELLCFNITNTWQHCPDSWSAGRSRWSDHWSSSPRGKRTCSPPLWPPSPSGLEEVLSLWVAPLRGSSLRSQTCCHWFSCCLVWLPAALGSFEDVFPYRFLEKFADKYRKNPTQELVLHLFYFVGTTLYSV